MRAVTLKVKNGSVSGMIVYYEGLAIDQQRRDGRSRGPVDYYLDPNEPPGRWWGAGCDAVDLKGDVLPEQFRALLEGKHPGPNRKLRRNLGRAFGIKSARGFDATFSASKSVSVLWALSDDPWVRAEVLAAHDGAVIAALEWFQRIGAVTRRGKDGIYQIDTQGLIVAVFRQHTSRTGDPQLHTHAVILAKVLDLDGNWLSLDARFLKRQQRSLGRIYDAALRTELTARLGVGWQPVIDGHADIEGVPQSLIAEFSRRTGQVETETAEAVAEWIADHDGATPDHRTLYRLERDAALHSRPDKDHIGDAATLRASWRQRAAEIGVDSLSLPREQRQLPGMAGLNREAIIAEALQRVTAQSSTWLAADVAREIATLVPPDATSSARATVDLVDELAQEAASRCVELHPPAGANVARRRDGRPVTEHVTDRYLTTAPVLSQEARLLSWARHAAGTEQPRVPADGDSQAAVARAVSGNKELVLVVGPAGAGKTTALGQAASSLRQQRRQAIGLAPSGKAADVLAQETGWPATTLAKLLYEHRRPNGPQPAWQFPAETSVVLDESGMASTEDLDALVDLVQRNRWRLVCVGDPAQLPAVGRGGMFADWCEELPAHHLDQVHRFNDHWQAEASLALRQGDPDAAAAYDEHHKLKTIHPALLPDQIARLHEAVTGRGESVAITTASVGTARSINVEIQRRRNPRRAGASIPLDDGTRAFVGDTVATRRNDVSLVTAAGSVRNRQTWTVAHIGDDGSLTLADLKRGRIQLPARYVARHVELGWAVTGYGNQGVTTDHGICVVEPSSSRAGIYVAMTRGRGHNLALIVDKTGEAEAQEAFASAISRPANSFTAHAMRVRLGGEVPPPVVKLDDRPARITPERQEPTAYEDIGRLRAGIIGRRAAAKADEDRAPLGREVPEPVAKLDDHPTPIAGELPEPPIYERIARLRAELYGPEAEAKLDDDSAAYDRNAPDRVANRDDDPAQAGGEVPEPVVELEETDAQRMRRMLNDQATRKPRARSRRL